MILRTTLLAAALLAAAPLINARSINTCDANSSFDLTLHPHRIELTREDNAPQRVELVDGRLWLDNREQELSAEDRARVRRFESELRALVPEVRRLAIEGVAIAVDALGTVIEELGGDSERMQQLRRDLVRHGREWRERIEKAQTTREWGRRGDAEFAGKLVAQMAPMLAAELASSAVRAALSGDSDRVAAIQSRADRLGDEIESRIKSRADRLEHSAKALCPRVRELDRIDNALAIRTADNRRVELIELDE